MDGVDGAERVNAREAVEGFTAVVEPDEDVEEDVDVGGCGGGGVQEGLLVLEEGGGR